MAFTSTSLVRLRLIGPDSFEGTGPITTHSNWVVSAGASDRDAATRAAAQLPETAPPALATEIAALSATPRTSYYAILFNRDSGSAPLRVR